MAPFTPLVFLDTWSLSASLRGKLALFKDAGDPLDMIAQTVVAREPSGKLARILKEWRSLAIVIDRLRKLPLADEHEFGEIAIHRLAPDTATHWQRKGEWQRAHLAIVTNPLCFTFCGVVAQSLPIGTLTLVDASAPCCCANWGETPFFWLTAEFRKRAPEGSGEDEPPGEPVAL